jgi:phage protein
MENLMSVASYVFNRYQETMGEKIDEMKFHKLLYFAQRESIIQKNEPLFAEVFYGWKFGPVLKEIRNAYREDTFLKVVDEETVSRLKDIMDKVFEEYASKDSWSLSRLTHGEVSWKNSRKDIPEGANSDNPMCLEDIIKDAERIKQRRIGLANLGLA